MEKQKDRGMKETERQKDDRRKKKERQKHRVTEIQRDKNTEKQRER